MSIQGDKVNQQIENERCSFEWIIESATRWSDYNSVRFEISGIDEKLTLLSTFAVLMALAHRVLIHRTLAHRTLAHQTLTRRTLSRQTLAHTTLAHQTLAHQTLAHRTLAHRALAHRTLAHRTLANQTLAHWTSVQTDINQAYISPPRISQHVIIQNVQLQPNSHIRYCSWLFQIKGDNHLKLTVTSMTTASSSIMQNYYTLLKEPTSYRCDNCFQFN